VDREKYMFIFWLLTSKRLSNPCYKLSKNEKSKVWHQKYVLQVLWLCNNIVGTIHILYIVTFFSQFWIVGNEGNMDAYITVSLSPSYIVSVPNNINNILYNKCYTIDNVSERRLQFIRPTMFRRRLLNFELRVFNLAEWLQSSTSFSPMTVSFPWLSLPYQ